MGASGSLSGLQPRTPCYEAGCETGPPRETSGDTHCPVFSNSGLLPRVAVAGALGLRPPGLRGPLPAETPPGLLALVRFLPLAEPFVSLRSSDALPAPLHL